MRCVHHYLPLSKIFLLMKGWSNQKLGFFFKQYIRNKPTKWGFKLWVIADYLSAYTLDMVVYTGSGKRGNVLIDDFAPEGLRENGGEDWVALGFSAQMMEQVGASVVIKLCQPYFNLNHVLNTDNFYTSVPLYQSLLENGMYACGTAKKNSTDFPKSLKDDGVWEKGDPLGWVMFCVYSGKTKGL